MLYYLYVKTDIYLCIKKYIYIIKIRDIYIYKDKIHIFIYKDI